MNESYVELLVKRETPLKERILNVIAIALTAAFACLFFLTANLLMLIGVIVFGIAVYFVRMNTNLEYEYLYVDKELSVDKILAKTKRKKVTRVNIDRLEILAPLESYHLADYKNRTGKISDYSSGKDGANRYMMICDGQNRMIIEPNEELIKSIRNVAPRKVFTD